MADIYDEEEREELVDDDEISPEEEGFMKGAEMDGESAKCRNCGAKLDEKNTVETEIDGKIMWFCSEQCLEDYKENH
ncbi:hypothetical protein JW968_06345 [Candidatus Woesearchaeota archaeon]|nr:hypothetical protein [Candidatus Woesearchaeota archaeon]